MRQVNPNDAPELAWLIRSVWANHNPDPAWIARVILESNHATLVETDGDHLVGFVDAFSTIAANGTLRWEIDLLGVHPEWQGRGIGRRLINAVTAMGREHGATLARALVRTDNVASLTAFERCGFTAASGVCGLYVSDTETTTPALPPTDAHLIPVSTLSYSGIWVEGGQSAAALRAAQAIRSRFGWDVAGAVIPAGNPIPPDFDFAGSYHWLTRDLTS